MSVPRSVAATAASRIYLAALGLLVLPAYLKLLGAEAYGLVALFFLLQVWFQLLDLGFTATVAREAARFRAGSIDGAELRQLLRSLEGLFVVLTGVAGAVLLLLAEPLARHWLQLQDMPVEQAVGAIRLMALGIMLRLISELYRGLIAGFEQIGWLAACGAAFGTLRLLGVLPYLAWAGADPLQFFAFQLVAGALETLVLLGKGWRLLPRRDGPAVPWSLQPLRRVLGFALAMSLASVVWVAASQVDKLVLSGLLALGDFGAFSLAVSAAAAVLLATGALSDSLVPRFTTLVASGAHADLMRLYRQGTQAAGVLAWSAAVLLACHAETVLRVWTGDTGLAQGAAPILALYALGNAALAVGALPYTLQLASGRLRLHLLGTGLMVMLLVPGVVFAAGRWGATGAGGVWLAVNTLYLLAWTPVAHARFAPGLHLRWLLRDVLPVALAAAAAALATRLLPWPTDRVGAGLQLVAVAAAILLASAAGSSRARQWLLRRQQDPRESASS